MPSSNTMMPVILNCRARRLADETGSGVLSFMHDDHTTRRLD
jgi:hypothetical protein